MLRSFPDLIEAEGLCLRPMKKSDLPTVMAQLGNPDIAHWMAALRQPFTYTDAEEILALSQDPAQCLRMIEVEGTIVGCLRLAPDVWFWLEPAAQSQGLMLRALRTAISAHFASQAQPLFATCREDNHAAQALLIRLGFSRLPTRKRVFFQNEGRALTCHGYVMSCEQWLLLYPPTVTIDPLRLRPASQKDAPTLLLMLPRPGHDDEAFWPHPDNLSAFLEQHRCRIPGRGLFVIEDDNRRVLGMTLLDESSACKRLRFLTPEDAARHSAQVNEYLRKNTFQPE